MPHPCRRKKKMAPRGLPEKVPHPRPQPCAPLVPRFYTTEPEVNITSGRSESMFTARVPVQGHVVGPLDSEAETKGSSHTAHVSVWECVCASGQGKSHLFWLPVKESACQPRTPRRQGARLYNNLSFQTEKGCILYFGASALFLRASTVWFPNHRPRCVVSFVSCTTPEMSRTLNDYADHMHSLSSLTPIEAPVQTLRDGGSARKDVEQQPQPHQATQIQGFGEQPRKGAPTTKRHAQMLLAFGSVTKCSGVHLLNWRHPLASVEDASQNCCPSSISGLQGNTPQK